MAATPALQPGIAGAVAIALTRELDYLELLRIQTYPAIARLGPIPLAII